MAALTNVPYKIVVYTGDIRNAGTNANVYITLYGTRGQSNEYSLDNRENNYQRGDTDEFTLRMANLGDITQVKIRHDNSGIAAGWYLNKIVVNNPDSVQQGPWTFPCYKWLEGKHNARHLSVVKSERYSEESEDYSEE
ncbi:MAG: PLAT/LH2 domain-containing protein [Crocosphaera sp.]|nr:PLAT/LH2 domain-containing protein [Crocosphaera sp.]